MNGEGAAGDPVARYREVFGVSAFRAMFTAQLISVLGDVVAVVTLAVLIYQTNLLSAAFALAMTLPAVPIAGLLVLITLIGVLAPIIQGVRSALVPAILGPGPPFILGRSTIRAAAMLSQVIGNGIGGLLLAVLTPRQTLLVDAASFVAAAALMQFGTRDRPPGDLNSPGTRRVTPAVEGGRPSSIGRRGHRGRSALAAG